MNKPNNYDNTPTQGERVEILEGGHQLIIYQVVETETKKGKPMIVVQYDFAQGDRQVGLAANTYRDDVSPEKKWPHFATSYIQVEDQEGNTSRNFKTFCSSVEASNPGFKISWGDGFAACFRKKMVGAVFGPVENEYQGNISIRNELRWYCSVEKSKDAKVPELKKLKKDPGQPQGTPEIPGSVPGFMQVPEGYDDDLPFN